MNDAYFYDMWRHWVNVITDEDWERRGKTKEEAEAMVQKYYDKLMEC